MKLLLSKKYRVHALVVVIILIMLTRFGLFLATPAGDGKNVQFFDFSQGQSLKKIAAALAERQIITSAGQFVLYARLRHYDARVRAGCYQFNDGMTPVSVLRRLVAGEIYVQRFAVPEGYSIYQIAELLAGRNIFGKEEFLRECFSKPLLHELGIGGKSVEGYLYPSTYDITPRMTAAKLIRIMVAQFDKVYARDFAPRAQAAHLSTLKVVTIASLIEKEAVKPEEQPLIASVFYNRLRVGMPLQSDPTAVYGVRAFAGNVTKKDVMRATPYNTYLIRGLPPGPIGNPGSGAIEAALRPATTGYFYFVSKKDGTHYFSASLAEHNNAVRKYLKSGSSQPLAEYRNDYPSLTRRR